MNGCWKRFLRSAAFLLTAAASGIQSLAADPDEWRLLSRVQINPPGVRSFVETFFNYNQLKSIPGGDLGAWFFRGA